MVREFVRDPDGQLAVKVINYEKVELSTLQGVVNDAQNEYDAATLAHQDTVERLSKAEAALADAKSELEIGQGIASEPGVDAGAEAASGENPVDSSGTPSFAQDV